MHYQQHGDLIAALTRIADALENIDIDLAGISDDIRQFDSCQCEGSCNWQKEEENGAE